MVEVFKTNVTHQVVANRLITQLHKKVVGCSANFDLDDCDLILRVQYANETDIVAEVKSLFRNYGFSANPLTDEILPK